MSSRTNVTAIIPHLRGLPGGIHPFDLTANDDCRCPPGWQAQIAHVADNIAHAARSAARQERTITIDDIVF